MRAKVTQLDGKIVEYEGTPEEIRQVLASPWTVDFPYVNTPYVNNPAWTPPVFIPTFTILECVHEYPEVWMGLNPPPCKKCGMSNVLQSTTITSVSHTQS